MPKSRILDTFRLRSWAGALADRSALAPRGHRRDGPLDGVHVAHRAGVGRGRHRGVRAQGGRHVALARGGDVAGAGLYLAATLGQLRLVELEPDRALRDVDRDPVAVLDQR